VLPRLNERAEIDNACFPAQARTHTTAWSYYHQAFSRFRPHQWHAEISGHAKPHRPRNLVPDMVGNTKKDKRIMPHPSSSAQFITLYATNPLIILSLNLNGSKQQAVSCHPSSRPAPAPVNRISWEARDEATRTTPAGDRSYP
jgi:hypothetical protein